MTAIGSTRDETIRRMIAESDRFVAEQRQLMAESVRREQERPLPSWLRIGGHGGWAVTLAGLLARAYGWLN